ncbi:MAG: hypothetical protein JKX74_02660 [Flavobacteriales bacterium]|nr:hypothetical protein [Flavobacteriales bacterium]PCH86851.1 MAG: hypothetical protein COB88_06800 [Flavobacteriales bacterium]
MTYTKVIAVVVFLLAAAFAQAQDDLSPEKVRELTELHQKIRGTFQIQHKDSRGQPSYQLSLVEKIEAARSDTEITFIPYGSGRRILILPRQVIEAKDFEPIKLFSYSFTDEPTD